MNLLILYGNGLVAMQEKITSVKKNFDLTSIVEISGKELSFNQAVLNLSTPTLFSDKRLIILENFDETIQLDKIPDDDSLTVVIKFAKSIPSSSQLFSQAAKLKAQIIFFNEEKEISIFPFLDYLTNKDAKALTFLDKLLKEYGSQYILTMLFYMLRRLVLTPKNTSTFNLKKIEKGKINFPKDKMAYFYQEIITTDFKIKSGLMDEKQGLNLLVLRILA